MSSPNASWNEKPQAWKVERAQNTVHPIFAELNNPVYEKLLESLPVMLHGMDGSGRMTMANAAWLSSLGYSIVDVVGRSFSEFLPSESRTKLITTIYPKYLVSGECNAEEIYIHRKDGSLATVHLTMIAYRGDKGRLQKSVCLLKDVTGEKLAQISSSRNDRRFRAAFQNSVQGMAILSLGGGIEVANAALCETLKRSDADMVSKNFEDLMHRDDRGQFLNGMQRLLRGDIPALQQELRYMSGSGSVVHCATSVALVKNDKGEIEQLVAQLLDVTEKRQASHLAQGSHKLEMASQLAGSMASDFAGLLTVITGNLQLLDGKFGNDERAQKRLNEAIEAARRGTDVTRRLLAFAGKQTIEPADVDVNAQVRAMAQEISRIFGEATELNLKLAPANPRTLADASKLETVLLNLAENAREAMGGRGQLNVETQSVQLDHDYASRNPEVAPGNYVMIAMTDTGSGMTPDAIDMAFQPYFTTKTAGKGAGLGLSAAYGFVRQSGGHIEIFSEPGRGTSVKLYLPEHTRPAVSGSTASVMAVVNEAEPAKISSARQAKILVVEDQEAVRAVACGFLEDFGYDIIEAGDGFEALAKLQENPDVDLMFSDVVMPGGMNGFDLAQAAQSMRPDLKVVHTSGYPKGAMVHQDEPRFKEGFIIMKPYRREDLQKIIRDALDKQ